MLIFNEIKDSGEFCVSVIVPESVDELRGKLSRSGGTFTVRGRLSDEDYTDGNGLSLPENRSAAVTRVRDCGRSLS